MFPVFSQSSHDTGATDNAAASPSAVTLTKVPDSQRENEATEFTRVINDDDLLHSDAEDSSYSESKAPDAQDADAAFEGHNFTREKNFYRFAGINEAAELVAEEIKNGSGCSTSLVKFAHIYIYIRLQR